MSRDEIKNKVRDCVDKMPQRDNVRKISLFGSYLHEEEKPGSDIDLLLELEEPVGYFELVRMQDLLSNSLEIEVDLVTSGALSKYFRDEVLEEAQLLYEK